MEKLGELLGAFYFYCVPHFGTTYSVRGTTPDGQQVLVACHTPEQMQLWEIAEHRFTTHYFMFLGQPFWTRHVQHPHP